MIYETPAHCAPDSLPMNDSYRVYCWNDAVWFSACGRGDAITIHIAAESRDARKGLRRAVEEFCVYLFDSFPWCRMILGVIGVQSVVNLATKTGFRVVDHRKAEVGGKLRDVTLVARPRV